MSKITLILLVTEDTHLQATLDSIYTQSLEDTEIICLVADNLSLNLVNDSRIMTMEIEGNTSSLINKIIKNSKGEYILFVNASNELNNVLYNLYNEAKNHDADILLFKENNLENVENSELTYISRIVGRRVFDISKISDTIFKISENLFNKLYKKEFLTANNIEFNNEYYACEEKFIYESLLKSEKLAFTDEILYKTSNTYKPIMKEDFNEYLVMQEDILELLSNKGYNNASNNIIRKTKTKYDSLVFNKKESFKLLRQFYSKFLSEEFVNHLDKQNHKIFEQVLISESVEEYELLKNVYEDKKYTYRMKRYQQLLQEEHKKIKNFNNSLVSSNSWKLTKIFRIMK